MCVRKRSAEPLHERIVPPLPNYVQPASPASAPSRRIDSGVQCDIHRFTPSPTSGHCKQSTESRPTSIARRASSDEILVVRSLMAVGSGTDAGQNRSGRAENSRPVPDRCAPIITDWLLRRRGRQEQLNCSQQTADVHWFSDISIASTLQSIRFIFWCYQSGHSNNWNVPGLIVSVSAEG